MTKFVNVLNADLSTIRSRESSKMFPHSFSCYFISNHISCEKKGSLRWCSFQMKLQESPFRGIDVIYLRNMVHEAQAQKAMKENLIRD